MTQDKPAAESSACAAIQMTDGMECERCALAWDVDDVTPACGTVTFVRMRTAAIEEAERIEATQRALTAAPAMRKYRDQAQLRHAMEFRAIARLIDRVTGNPDIPALLKKAGRS
jgi:hypothetical protein